VAIVEKKYSVLKNISELRMILNFTSPFESREIFLADITDNQTFYLGQVKSHKKVEKITILGNLDYPSTISNSTSSKVNGSFDESFKITPETYSYKTSSPQTNENTTNSVIIEVSTQLLSFSERNLTVTVSLRDMKDRTNVGHACLPEKLLTGVFHKRKPESLNFFLEKKTGVAKFEIDLSNEIIILSKDSELGFEEYEPTEGDARII